MFRFQSGTAKGTEKMGKLPNIVYGWVEIGAYARRASKGGTYCPVCI